MAQLNANTPYIDCFLRKEITSLENNSYGFIFGCKSMINRPLLFHFQSNFGAIFWNLPISAFCHNEQYDTLDSDEQKRLSLLETWDCQSNHIATTSFKFLQFKRVDVICRDGQWRSGHYIFTIDDYEDEPNAINVGYSNDQDSKCFHFIKLDDGNFCIQPNNLLRWHNPDHIIPYDKYKPPKIKFNNERMTSEDIDRSFGNSPYYFYNNPPDTEYPNEQSKDDVTITWHSHEIRTNVGICIKYYTACNHERAAEITWHSSDGSASSEQSGWLVRIFPYGDNLYNPLDVITFEMFDHTDLEIAKKWAEKCLRG